MGSANQGFRNLEDARAKEQTLRRLLRSYKSVIVAFSGGVDSAYLAYIANVELQDQSLAVTGESPSYPSLQREIAARFVEQFGIKHLTIETDELDDPRYWSNPANRCYYCKTELYQRLEELAGERGFLVVCDGTNADDLGDFRPGREAAREAGVQSPLIDSEMTKADIRLLSEQAGLPTWDQPASACLASRIPYGQAVTIEKLSAVDRAENALKQMGFRQVRVRHHGDIARIEIAEEELPMALNAKSAAQISAALKALGFKYVTLDLEGYRTGSLNEALTGRRRHS